MARPILSLFLLSLTLAHPAGAQEPLIEPQTESEAGTGFFDLGWARLYVGVRIGVSIPTEPLADGLDLGRGDLYDASIGVNLGRFIGAELGMSLWEYGISSDELGGFGEWSAYTFIPSLRLRYPLLRDRLVPYVVGGVGFGYAELNDKTTDRVAGAAEPALAGSIGGGLVYFIARNLALGIDAKYQFLDREIAIDGQAVDASTRVLLFSGGLRAFFPETPAVGFEGVEWREPEPFGLRPYLSFRFGGRFYASDDFGEGALKSGANQEQTNSGSVGLGINRYLAFEIAVETHDTEVQSDPGGVKLAEYGTWNVLPSVMGRYPVAGGKLVPYGSLGFGFIKSDVNDRTLNNGVDGPFVAGGGWGPMWGAGLGLDFFIAENLTLILETKYVNGRSEAEVDGSEVEVDMSSVLISVGFRVFVR
jgi:opacity protein-like surface antigen